MRLRAVDLFCGGGGLSKGLMDAGFDVVAAFDNWPAALAFYNANIKGHRAEQADISDIDAMSARLKLMRADLIAGGPPCQDFSSAGKRNEGRRADLTVAYAKLVARVRPKYFIMENVERARRAEAFTEAIGIFREAGYGITEAVLDASLCGVPQIRKRVFVFGEMGGKNNTLTAIYRKRQAPKPMTLRDYFGKKLAIEHYYRHPRSYARRAVFSLDEPSPTVRGVNRPVPKGYPGHPGDAVPVNNQVRTLTTKERSMIQTFPENWVLEGTKTDLEQVIGNAVPCNLARFVGESIIEYLKNPAEYGSVDEEKQLIMFEQKVRYLTKQDGSTKTAPRKGKLRSSAGPSKKPTGKKVSYITQKKTKKKKTSARSRT